MRKFLLALSLVLGVFAGPALFAQATRTWVSGVGDDANPCSRTAPCKTFAGAISKTAAGGEISVLDPGGFGAINITKSITINGAGTLASILHSGTNGVIVNGPGIVVNLIDLSINGGTPSQPGVNGIRIIQAAHVSVNNCQIFNFSSSGIRDERTVAGTLSIRNTVIRDSIQLGANNATVGVHLGPDAGGAVNSVTTIEDSAIYNIAQTSSSSVLGKVGARVTISRSLIAGGERGVFCASSATCIVSDSKIVGLDTGIRALAGTTVRLSNTLITGCLVNGIEFAGGTIESFGNNSIAGNVGNNGAGLIPISLQ